MSIQSLRDAAALKFVNSTEHYPALHQPGDAGLPLLLVENGLGRAVLALQGAQLMAFQPARGCELLWLSPKAVLVAGKAIRGGIPLCTPWFGPGPDGKTAHGFARVLEWALIEADTRADGATRLILELCGDAATHALWPHAFSFRLEVIIGSKLEMIFSAENRSAEPAPFAFIFHTYFAVPAVREARVTGLEAVSYIDKLDDAARKLQQGEVSISAATDRIYLDAPATQVLKWAGGEVSIESGAKCAVIWNAWTNDKNIADIGDGNHAGYLCVERGDVADHAVTLQAGEAYRAWMTLS